MTLSRGILRRYAAGERNGLLVSMEPILGSRWLFLCDCGKTHETDFANVRAGSVKSCGHLRIGNPVRHGMSRTPLHNAWMSMISRCSDPNNRSYKNYGGRGIKVCERWLGRDGFQRFMEDMGPKPTTEHTVERKNNDLGYSPDNCTWATRREQVQNRRPMPVSCICGACPKCKRRGVTAQWRAQKARKARA